jgi:MFS-type transporter involved in bile tolerance (Atg22 family)
MMAATTGWASGNCSAAAASGSPLPPRVYVGATIGLYSCIGFGASFLGTLLFGVTLDQFGGTSQLAAWVVSFGTCGLARLAGVAATVFLPRNIWQR